MKEPNHRNHRLRLDKDFHCPCGRLYSEASAWTLEFVGYRILHGKEFSLRRCACGEWISIPLTKGRAA